MSMSSLAHKCLKPGMRLVLRKMDKKVFIQRCVLVSGGWPGCTNYNYFQGSNPGHELTSVLAWCVFELSNSLSSFYVCFTPFSCLNFAQIWHFALITVKVEENNGGALPCSVQQHCRQTGGGRKNWISYPMSGIEDRRVLITRLEGNITIKLTMPWDVKTRGQFGE